MNRTLATLAAILLSSAAFAQTTAPEIRNPFPPSSPQGAAESLSIAMSAGDAVAIRSYLDAKTDPERKMVDAMVHMSQAIVRLRNISIKRFGQDLTKPVLGDPAAAAAEEHAHLESALLTLERDKAVLTFPDPTSDPMVLRRSPASPDRWVVSIADKSADLSPAELETRTADLEINAKIIDEVAALCEGGKWATPSDVLIAVQERTIKSQESRLPTTAPTSAPATAPAK